jgi:hypothetical protein
MPVGNRGAIGGFAGFGSPAASARKSSRTKLGAFSASQSRARQLAWLTVMSMVVRPEASSKVPLTLKPTRFGFSHFFDPVGPPFGPPRSEPVPW